MDDFLQSLTYLSTSDPSPIYYSLLMLAVALMVFIGIAVTNVFYATNERFTQKSPQEERLMEEHSILFRCMMSCKNDGERVFWRQKLIKIEDELDQIKTGRSSAPLI